MLIPFSFFLSLFMCLRVTLFSTSASFTFLSADPVSGRQTLGRERERERDNVELYQRYVYTTPTHPFSWMTPFGSE
jgi:hypothetical protein